MASTATKARRAPTAPKPAAQVNPDLLDQLVHRLGASPRELDTVTKTARLVLAALRSGALIGWSVTQLSKGRYQIRNNRGAATISDGELRTAAGANPALARLRQLGLDDAVVASRGNDSSPATTRGTDAPGKATAAATAKDAPKNAANGAANGAAVHHPMVGSSGDMDRLVQQIKDTYDDVPDWAEILPLPDPEAGRSVAWCVLTPDMAQRILDECDQDVLVDGQPQRHNRKVSKVEVRKDAARIRAGHWQLIHQGLAFDTAGNLRDGRTRVEACIEAGMPIPIQVAFNQRPTEFAAYDIARRRTGADVLYTSGVDTTNTSAAWSANGLVYSFHQRLDPKTWRNTATSTDREELTLHLQANPGLVVWVDTATELRKQLRTKGKALTAPVAPHAAALFVCEEAYPDGRYSEFVDGLGGIADPSRDGLRAGDPRRAYYDFLLGFSVGNRTLSPIKAMAVMIKAINAWNRGVTVEHNYLRWRENERMPQPWTPEP
jgi:hypothetical protein